MNLRIFIGTMSVFMVPLFFGLPSTGSAQDQSELDCPYSECSLRLKTGFFGRSVVRGDQEEKLLGLGFWAGSLEPVFQGSPQAIELGSRFRHRHNLGGLIALAGFAAVAAGYHQSDWDPFSSENDAGVGLVVTGAVLTFLGQFVSWSGEDALHKAIWEYNRTLVPWSSTGDDAR